MAIFSTIAAGTGAAKAAGLDFKNVFKPISGLFGGSSCSSSDKQQRKEIENAIRQYLSPGDMQNLVRGMESDVQPNPASMARFFLGGRDCKHKNVSPGDQRFLDRLPGAIERAAAEKKKAQPGSQNNFTASVTSAGGFSGIASNQTVLWLFAALFGAGIFISNYEKWFK